MNGAGKQELAEVWLKDAIIGADTPVLVTGAAGFIGKRVVATLLRYGLRNVRCFVRPSRSPCDIDALGYSEGASPGIQIIRGNLLSREDCVAAARDVAV
ncbi:MAG TPA: NAD-dependent epimerase/dehydratase family protein, partial [Candidatus Eremiobacteraceae bacterium]|nr:NAD-dependent epimerase/dehydratase family protein [Candidatus Eremiobacteraceae bacterium]